MATLPASSPETGERGGCTRNARRERTARRSASSPGDRAPIRLRLASNHGTAAAAKRDCATGLTGNKQVESLTRATDPQEPPVITILLIILIILLLSGGGYGYRRRGRRL